MRLTEAPAALRAAGLRVVERRGWRNRDNGRDLTAVRGLTVHHTAGARNSTVEGELRVIEQGRPGLSGPISQFMVARDGTWYCTAAGSANHNKVGWGGPNTGYGNSHLIGVECQHSGAGEPWTPVQYRSVVTGVAALARRYGFTHRTVGGHKEHQPGEKVDPSFGMDGFRRAVAEEIRAQEDGGVSAQDVVTALNSDEGQAALVKVGRNHAFLSDTDLWKIGQVVASKLTGLTSAVAALASANETLKGMIEAGEATDAADLAAVQAKVEEAAESVRQAIADLERPEGGEPDPTDG